MSKTLFGKVALVTGGSRGLGAATAAALAHQGADVAISYLASRGAADAVVNGLRMQGVRAIAIQADQGDPTVSAPLMQKVVEAFGKLDILVNNAAVAWQGKTIDDPERDNAATDRQWAINTMGVIANIRAASRVLPEGGRIISVGSGLGTRVAFPGTTDYAATKAAIVGYSRGAARDLGRRNITVNVVQAGLMDTWRPVRKASFLRSSRSRTQYNGTPNSSEVAAEIVVLAGPNAGFITGSIIEVNGGFIA